MATDERGLQPTDAAPRVPVPASLALSSTALPEPVDALQAIGYEAADPVLHAPQWAEAMVAGAHGRSLR
jgi:hypothetical protein